MPKRSDRFSNRIRVRCDMRGAWVWHLITPDGHIAQESESFGEDRDACEADAKGQGLPVEGLSRNKRALPDSSKASQVTDHLLSRIPGEHIAKALQTLPRADRAGDDVIMETIIEVPELGRVRITARRMKHKHGRSTHYFWTAESASVDA